MPPMAMASGSFGISLAKRTFPAAARPTVICLTTRNSVQDKVDALRAGASDYLVKPATHIPLGLRLQLLERFERLRRDEWTV